MQNDVHFVTARFKCQICYADFFAYFCAAGVKRTTSKDRHSRTADYRVPKATTASQGDHSAPNYLRLNNFRNLQTATNYKNSIFSQCFNPLMGTLKPQSNETLYSNTVIDTLPVDGWAVPNVTAHPLTASTSITALLYNGPLLCRSE